MFTLISRPFAQTFLISCKSCSTLVSRSSESDSGTPEEMTHFPLSRCPSLQVLQSQRPGARFTNGFSISIQIRRKFRFTLTSVSTQWSLHKILYMARHLCCRGMCKIFLPSDGQQRSYGKAKFPSNLNCGQKTLVKRAPGHCFEFLLIMDTWELVISLFFFFKTSA